ncbi:hypothetical protein U1Q18_041915 [Sarracenia purpurea var. burkii]
MKRSKENYNYSSKSPPEHLQQRRPAACARHGKRWRARDHPEGTALVLVADRREVGFTGVRGAATESQMENFTRGGKATYKDCSVRFADKRSGEARSCRSCRRTQRRRRAIFRID